MRWLEETMKRPIPRNFSTVDFYMTVAILDAKKLLTTVQRENKHQKNIQGIGLKLELNWCADQYLIGNKTYWKTCAFLSSWFIIFNFLGFAVVLLVIHYLQAGCSPPVAPALQQTFPSIFQASNSVLIEKLIAHVPDQIRAFKSSNTQSLGEL